MKLDLPSILLIAAGVAFIAGGCGENSTAEPRAEQVPGQLLSITDVHPDGNVEAIRTNFKFRANGLRVANDVFASDKSLIAVEKFAYDTEGTLTERSYLTDGKKLKWRWVKIDTNDAGQPIRNDIVNARGKNIGHYTWQYDEGRLSRRDRFEADGSLRFYYADMEYDEHGEYAKWTKFDANDEKIGTKIWKYAPR